MTPLSISHLPASACFLCDSAGTLQTLATRDRHGRPLTTALCTHCGIVTTDPRPTPAEVDHFYRADYRREYKQSYTPKPRHVLRSGRVALERLHYLLPLLSSGDKVLDAGCGGGELLFLLRELGFDADGLEPNLGYGSTARDYLDLPVQVTGYQGAEVQPESRDAIVSFHVLEHLLNPVDALRTFANWLKPDGVILIEVPNVFSRCQWPASRYHRGHLQHFSASTLALTARKAGLTTLDSFTSPDGGNLMLVLAKSSQTTAEVPSPTGAHAARVKAHLLGHTTLVHAMSAAPYLRPLKRLASNLAERAVLSRHRQPRDILLHLAQQARQLSHCPDHNIPPSFQAQIVT